MDLSQSRCSPPLICLLFSGSGLADEVYMKNGDRFTGVVKTTKDGKLMFETSYAGEMGIGLAAIQRVVYETDRTNLSIEAGPAYIWENYDTSENQDYAAAHWGLRFDHYLLEAWKLQAFHRHSLDWSLEDSSAYLFKSQTGLRIPIFDSLQATVQVNFDRNNNPAEDAKKNDYEYLLTGGYTG